MRECDCIFEDVSSGLRAQGWGLLIMLGELLLTLQGSSTEPARANKLHAPLMRLLNTQ